MNKPDPFQYLHANKECAFELFALVSRLDFALIRCRFRQKGRPVYADWNSFAESVASHLCKSDDAQVKAAIEYLYTEPPQKLSVRGGRIDWVASSVASTSPGAWAVKAAHQVRNNLFHGVKGYDQKRNDRLINAALIVLYECLKVDSGVLRAFNSPP